MITNHWYTSKTVWTMILMFIVGGVQAISGSLNPNLLTAIMLVLGACGSFFHISSVNSALAGRYGAEY
jgi:hypothetical protein